MSYTRHYSAVISGSQTERYTYPKSESGGSGTVTVHWSEPVHIAISVETADFDHSVGVLKHNIDGLTLAVSATEAAHIEEKRRSAQAIGESVISGFFTLIRSEITQQMASIKSKVESLVIKMKDLIGASQRVHQSMQQDYSRITSRYSALFEELDRELASRVTNLDRAAHDVLTATSFAQYRSFGGLLWTSSTVLGSETAHSQNTLLSGAIRAKMHSLLSNATGYLASEKTMNAALKDMLGEGAGDSVVYLPVAYARLDESSGATSDAYFIPPSPNFRDGDMRIRQGLESGFYNADIAWKPLADKDREQVQRNLFSMVGGIATKDGSDSNDHDARVRAEILRLWNAHTPSAISR